MPLEVATRRKVHTFLDWPRSQVETSGFSLYGVGKWLRKVSERGPCFEAGAHLGYNPDDR